MTEKFRKRIHYHYSREKKAKKRNGGRKEEINLEKTQKILEDKKRN